MANYKTPATLWSDFDDTLETDAEIVFTKTEGDVCFEYVCFLGRDTGEGRVKIYGAFAHSVKNPSNETVLILPDSTNSIDEKLIKFFVSEGYSAFMPDYRGDWSSSERFTEYPKCVSYANAYRSQSSKVFIESDAAKTCWYEWVAVGIYSRKYIYERTKSMNIGLVGIRDGGEIAWKLAALKKFNCLIAVCAAGWKAYSGIAKYGAAEELNSDKYHFLAGLDSQAYAPYVACPVMMLCSTNDPSFDYDRAYDTFKRINPEFIDDSVITYSVKTNSSVGARSTANMFMFLGKYLKQRQVFIPQPVDIAVSDKDGTLIATATADSSGSVEYMEMHYAEDCIDSSVRDFCECKIMLENEPDKCVFQLDVYEKSTLVFVLCCAHYSSGFTAWSKMTVKRLSGSFTNMQKRCRVLCSGDSTEGFSSDNPAEIAIGGVFKNNDDGLPEVVVKNGIKGLYSKYGLTTYRLNSPRFAPEKEYVLKLDVFCDENCDMQLCLQETDGETYKHSQSVLGGVWQSIILESKMFKSLNGDPLESFTGNLKFSIGCGSPFAVNNIIWL